MNGGAESISYRPVHTNMYITLSLTHTHSSSFLPVGAVINRPILCIRINTALAYIMLTVENIYSWHLSFTWKCLYLVKYNEEQRMPKTRRSEEPFCEPSVEAFTEAEGRHSNSAQESEVH